MTAAQEAPPALRQDCWPIVPDRVEDLGIPRSVVADLVLRYLWLHGSGTLARLNESLKLSFPVLETLFHQFRNQQLLEVKGMTGNQGTVSLSVPADGGYYRVEATARTPEGRDVLAITDFWVSGGVSIQSRNARHAVPLSHIG